MTRPRRKSRSDRLAEIAPYKSRLELATQEQLPDAPYEKKKLSYIKEHTYTPDFELRENVFLECKGRWLGDDRAKHLLIRKYHPEVTVYFLFERPYNTLNKGSKTTYADWCDKHGYEWTTLADGIPSHWLQPKDNDK